MDSETRGDSFRRFDSLLTDSLWFWRGEPVYAFLFKENDEERLGCDAFGTMVSLDDVFMLRLLTSMPMKKPDGHRFFDWP